MTLGRSEAEFWRMTPAKLHAIAELHEDIHSDKGGEPAARKVSQNPAADLAAFSSDFA